MDEDADRNESADPHGSTAPHGGAVPNDGTAPHDGADSQEGGEAVCWIGQLCPACGAMPEGAGAQDPSVPCWRCGTIRSETTGA